MKKIILFFILLFSGCFSINVLAATKQIEINKPISGELKEGSSMDEFVLNLDALAALQIKISMYNNEHSDAIEWILSIDNGYQKKIYIQNTDEDVIANTIKNNGVHTYTTSPNQFVAGKYTFGLSIPHYAFYYDKNNEATDEYIPNNAKFYYTVTLVSDSPKYNNAKQYNLNLDGKSIAIDPSYGQIFADDNGRLQVPLRGFATAMGLNINWDEYTKSITVDNYINFMIGSKLIVYSNELLDEVLFIMMDTTPIVKDGITYIPLRFICNALGYDVNYVDGQNPKIIITSQGNVSKYYMPIKLTDIYDGTLTPNVNKTSNSPYTKVLNGQIKELVGYNFGDKVNPSKHVVENDYYGTYFVDNKKNILLDDDLDYGNGLVQVMFFNGSKFFNINVGMDYIDKFIQTFGVPNSINSIFALVGGTEYYPSNTCTLLYYKNMTVCLDASNKVIYVNIYNIS